jgi:protein-S-isoprenylcysteine O-methyltransferase Ste14
MSATGAPAAAAEISSSHPLSGLLGKPWFDRTVAIIASVPFVFYAHRLYVIGGINVPLVALWISLGFLIAPMIARRPPKRVTLNPAYWLLTYVETYWLLMPILGPGHRIVSNAVSDTLSICSLAIVIWGRISLGRNIGFVPAQRELVASGAYRYVRHPIYTSLLLVYLGVALRLYSPRNAVLIAIGMFWFVLKSLVEEKFLRQDPRYAAYMDKVRARWIPFIL